MSIFNGWGGGGDGGATVLVISLEYKIILCFLTQSVNRQNDLKTNTTVCKSTKVEKIYSASNHGNVIVGGWGVRKRYMQGLFIFFFGGGDSICLCLNGTFCDSPRRTLWTICIHLCDMYLRRRSPNFQLSRPIDSIALTLCYRNCAVYARPLIIYRHSLHLWH